MPEFCRYLTQQNISAEHYHGKLDPVKRRTTQDRWMSGDVDVVVATTAFGMGIDKPSVRFVVHFTMALSPENYYQEAGHAGRDGLYSECILFYSEDDVNTLRRLIEGNKNPMKGPFV